MTESHSFIDISQDGGIQHIVFNRPEKKHALTHAMYSALNAAVRAAEADPAVRVLLISGSQGMFTAGNDLQDFLQHPPENLQAPVFLLLEALRTASKPIVAAVQGPAVGIGSTLLLHCDLVYCDDSARFRLPFVSLGLCPEAGSSYLLPLIAGHRKAAELLLLGEVFDAATALDVRLVNKVLPGAELLDYAQAKARQLAAQPAASVRLTKALMKKAGAAQFQEFMAYEGEQFIARVSSPEAREAFSAFMEKRAPDFSRFNEPQK